MLDVSAGWTPADGFPNMYGIGRAHLVVAAAVADDIVAADGSDSDNIDFGDVAEMDNVRQTLWEHTLKLWEAWKYTLRLMVDVMEHTRLSGMPSLRFPAGSAVG